MRDEEYPAFADTLRAGYVEDIVNSGFLPRSDAEAKADRDIAADLPEGLQTPDTYVYVVEDEDGMPVGHAWVAVRPNQAGVPRAFVFDLWISDAHRGRGLGRAAMLALEEEARGWGLDRMELNVFGHNEVARRLYRSLGYDELSVLMGKTLS
jgi:GNAT superfamily N-acetyltransferase